MHPVLQQVQRNAEGHAEFLVKAKLAETEKVLANIFGKVTSNELIAARKAPPAGLEGTPVPESKPAIPSLNNAVSNLKKRIPPGRF